MLENRKLINAASVSAMLTIGGFVGWFLTVMYICRMSLEIYGTSALFAGMEIIFDGALLVLLGVMLILMFHLDFEGLLGHRYFRAVPGLLMAESGIALAFTNADSFGVYAVITGLCAAFGALAVFSSLLNVRMSLRLFSVGAGAAIGGLVRLLAQVIYTATDITRGIYVLAVLSGLLALLTVRSSGFSREDMPIISYSEASHKVLLRSVPGAYYLLFILIGLYHLCLGRIDALGAPLSPPLFNAYDVFTYVPYVLTALIIALFLKFHTVTPLYVFGCCFTAYAAILLYLPYFSAAENGAFLACRFIGQACFDVFVYIVIVTFAMDRQHPLFYTVFGYACVIAARLTAHLVNYFYPVQRTGWLLAALAFLLVFGAPVIYNLLRKYGLTQESFEHRNSLRSAIARKSEALALTDREKYLLELVVLDDYTMEQLPDKMMLSRNTVRAQMRNLLQKLDVPDITGLRASFEEELHTKEPTA